MIAPTTRRALLAGGGAALAIVVTPAGGATAGDAPRRWALALQRWEGAVALVQSRADDAAAMPAGPAQQAAHAALDAASDIEDEAWRALIDMPSPHGAALLWKLEYLMEPAADGGSSGWAGDVVAPVMADARRLLGGAA